MVVAELTTAYQALRFAKESLSTLVKLKIDAESLAKVTAALQQLTEVQDALFQAQAHLLELQAEAGALRRQVEANDNWAKVVASYSLVRSAGGAHVYASRDQPSHFACPSCIASRKLHILQDLRYGNGAFRCPGCRYEYLVAPAEPEQHQARTEYDPFA